MLTILLGRANTGKSTFVLDRLCALGDTSQQLLIVPDHTSHLVEVDVCHACGDRAASHVQVLGFHRLCDRILTITGGGAQVTLDGGGKLVLLQKALGEVASELKVYRKPSQRVAFLEQLMAVLDELRSYGVTPETLFALSETTSGATGDKFWDLSLLYGAYEGKLRRPGFDGRDKITKLCDLLETSNFVKDKDIFLDGFTYFTSQELTAIAVMLRQGRSVTITLLGDESGNSLFETTLKTRDALVRLAKDTGVRVTQDVLEEPVDTPLRHFQRYAFDETIPWEEAQTAITLRQAQTLYDEVEQTASDILSLASQGTRYRDITVYARNMGDYEATIETVFARYAIPAYISRRSDILEKPALSLVVGVLSAVTGGFEYEDVFRCLKTGLAGLSLDDCDQLENYVLKWEIHGQMWIKDVPWEANPDGYGAPWGDWQTQRLEHINALRELVRLPLSNLWTGLRQGETTGEKVMALYHYLEEIQLQTTLETQMEAQAQAGFLQGAEETAQLWDILCGVLDQLVETLGDEPTDTESFAQLLRLMLTQYSIGTIPVSLDQVSVSELTRHDRHTTPHLFLLGVNDGVMPSVGQSGGILNQDERSQLALQGVQLAPSGMEQIGLELLLVYAAISKATTSLTVSYPTTSVGGGQLRPAFLVERLHLLFPDLKLSHTNAAQCRQNAVIPALELAGQDPSGALWAHFHTLPQYHPQLSAMERGRTMGRGRLSPKGVQALYGKTFRMSASRVERLRSCHFAYFMEYGLKAKSRTVAALDAPQIGTFLHYILERITTAVLAQGGFDAVTPETIHALVEQFIQDYVKEVLGSLSQKNARFQYLFNRLRTTVYTVVDQVAEELRCSDFVPVAFELGFGGDGALPGVTISSEGTQLSLTGKVDRVDGWVKDDKLYLRVVDYKSGKKAFDLSAVSMGLDIQMLMYLFALQAHGQAHFGKEIVPAGVLYFPARDPIVSATRSISPEKLKEALDKELRRTGLLLRDPDVLTAMEHEALTQPRYLPIRVDKSGSLSGSIAMAEQLGQLGVYVEKTLEEVAGELREGNINADPWAKSEEDTFCRFCQWRDACHFQDGRGGDRLHYMTPMKDDAFWAQVSQVVEEEDAL